MKFDGMPATGCIDTTLRITHYSRRCWETSALGRGFACYGIATLLYLKVLARLDLSLAYPTVSLGYVLVIVMSKVFFKERISPARWLGVVIICAGVAMVGLGSV